MRRESIFAAVFALLMLGTAALSQVGQPGVTSPSVTSLSGTLAGPLLAPSGCTTIHYSFNGLTDRGICVDGDFNVQIRGGGGTIGATAEYVLGADLVTLYPRLTAGNATATQPGWMSASVFEGRELKVITESVATTFVSVKWPSLSGGYRGGRMQYCVVSFDTGTPTNYQYRCGSFNFAVAVISGGGGTPSCVMGPASPTETTDGSAFATTNGGTLTYTFTTSTSANTCDFQVNAVSSYSQIALGIVYLPITSDRSGVEIDPA